MAFPSAAAPASRYVSVVTKSARATVFLRNHFSLSIYITDMTVIIPAGEGLL
jgi:hypothetical protein